MTEDEMVGWHLRLMRLETPGTSVFPWSADGYVLEPTEWLKGSQTSSGVWREDTGLLSRDEAQQLIVAAPAAPAPLLQPGLLADLARGAAMQGS